MNYSWTIFEVILIIFYNNFFFALSNGLFHNFYWFMVITSIFFVNLIGFKKKIDYTYKLNTKQKNANYSKKKNSKKYESTYKRH